MSLNVPSDSTIFGAQPERDANGGDAVASFPSTDPGYLQVQWSTLADGRFEPRKLLGRGGFAMVYRAYDRKLKREVALKLPHFKMVSDHSAQKWLRREGLATAALNHNHIVKLFDLHIGEDASYLVCELIEGKSLAEFIQQHPHGCEPKLAANIVLCIADALAHAHDNKVLHRDVKPSNILLDDGTPTQALPFSPRLADFGLASAPSQETLSRTTDNLIGSIHYLPPEVIQGQTDSFTVRGDIYALAAVLYELLTGRQAFSGATIAQIMNQIVQGELTSIRKLRPDVPKDLEAICLQGLATSPAKRYATSALFAKDLQNFLHGKEVIARQPTWFEGMQRAAKRHPAITSASLLVMASVLGFIGLVMVNNRQLETQNISLEAALAEAKRARYQNEQIIYALDMAGATADLQKGDLRSVRTTLERYQDGSSLAKHRDVEWQVLSRKTQRESRLLWQANDALYVASYNSDGRWLAVGGKDATATILDADTGQIVRQWDTGQIEVNAVVFSPDDSILWTTGDDGAVCAWQVETGQQLWRCQVLEAGGKAYNLVSLPKQQHLIVRGGDGLLYCLSIDGQLITDLNAPPADNRSLQKWGNRRLLLTGSTDEELRLIDGKTLQLTKSMVLRRDTTRVASPINAIAVSPDGRLAVTGNRSHQVSLVDLAQWKLLDEITLPDAITNFVFLQPSEQSAAGEAYHLIAGTRQATYYEFIIPADDKLMLHDSWSSSADRTFGMIAHPTRNQVTTLAADGTVRQFKLDNTKNLLYLPGIWNSHSDLSHLLWDKNQHRNGSLQAESMDYLLVTASSQEMTCIDSANPSAAVVIESFEESPFICDDGNGNLWVIRSPTNARRIAWSALQDAIRQKPPGDESVDLPWIEQTLPMMANRPRSDIANAGWLALSRGSNWMGGYDQQEGKVWFSQVDNPAALQTFDFKSVDHIYIEADGRRCWWNSLDDLYCLKLDGSAEPEWVTRLPSRLIQVAQSPDQSLLAIVCGYRECLVWDIERQRQVGSNLLHVREIVDICFSPSGQTLMTLDQDGNLNCWNVTTGRKTYGQDDHAKAHPEHHRGFSCRSQFLLRYHGNDHLQVDRLYSPELSAPTE